MAIAVLGLAPILGVVSSSAVASATSLSQDRAKAQTLLNQINTINARVERLGQKYDLAQIHLHRINNEIVNTKSVVASIKGRVERGNTQLRHDVIFSYVTSGAGQRTNPLFTPNATNIGATKVYSKLAEGNISTTIANLKSYRIELTRERSLLSSEDARARAATRTAASSFHSAKILQATLKNTLSQVKGQIGVFVSEAQAAQNAQSASSLQNAQPVAGFPAPPPDSKANIAIRAALSMVGVPYVWGGASRSGVDCSGLVMLAYAAAGIQLSHYSGSQYQETMRVPLYDIQPGDILFYGPGGDEHEAMYLGQGKMVEAEMTGTLVHVVPVRLGYGFTGLGRPRG